MKFAHPEILWALAALAVPVIVHLFNFRRFKRIAFSNVAFLREVQIETKSRNRLRHLLILLSRLLAMTFLILAFAQPFIPLDDQTSKSTVRSVSLFIDNSFSMEALGEDGALLDLAKARASEVVSAYQPTDRFNIITNDLEGRHQRFYTQEDALNLIAEIDPSPTSRLLSEVIERQQDLLLREGEGDLSVFVFSDLQKNTHDGGFVPDSAIAVRFIPDLAARSQNIFIDSVWFDTPVRLPGQPEVLRMRIRNTAEIGRDNIPMRLDINGRQAAIGSFNVLPGTYTDTALYFTNESPGIKHLKVNIQDHPVVYDDDWFLSFSVARKVNVLLIKGESDGRAFRTMFSNDPFFMFSDVDAGRVNYGDLPNFDLIIVDRLGVVSSGLTRELASFMESGKTVLFIPADTGDVDSWNELLLAGGAPPINGKRESVTKVSELNLNHMLYRGVFDRIPENIDLPVANYFYSFARSSRSGDEPILTLQTGDPFLFTSSAGEGRMYVSAVSLNPSSGNFAQHAIFVPTMLRVAELSRPAGRMDATIGDNNVLTVPGLNTGSDAAFALRRIGSEQQLIPRHRPVRGGIEVFIGDDRTDAGNYELLLGDSVVSVIGLNYPRKESVLEAWAPSAWEEELTNAGWPRFNVLQTNMETISKTIEELDEGKRLWDVFLLLAALMLVAEILLIKIRTS